MTSISAADNRHDFLAGDVRSAGENGDRQIRPADGMAFIPGEHSSWIVGGEAEPEGKRFPLFHSAMRHNVRPALDSGSAAGPAVR
ncbi:hypothetical protein [Klebsiella pneumoniae]|uniref:hypothetical protein n=1 Tax=Klebsiella pneumoniae TaxID=573 RepID=UPI00388E6657